LIIFCATWSAAEFGFAGTVHNMKSKKNARQSLQDIASTENNQRENATMWAFTDVKKHHKSLKKPG
jgi:hypothetical protein